MELSTSSFHALFNMYSNLKFWNLQLFSSVPKKRNSMNVILPSESLWENRVGPSLISKFWEESHGCELPSELIFHIGILSTEFHYALLVDDWWKTKIPQIWWLDRTHQQLIFRWICVETHFIWNFSWTVNTDVNEMFCWTLIDFSESHLQPMNLLANTCSVSCSRSKVSSLSGSLCFISAFNRCFCIVLLFGFLICPK